MAKTVVVVLQCDRCKAEKGEEVEGTESVSFAYDGYSYSLDLCPSHAEDFHNTIQSLIGWASDRSRLSDTRRIRTATTDGTGSSEARRSRRSVADRERLKAIREWARKHGHPELSDRGRIPQAIIDEYEATDS